MSSVPLHAQAPDNAQGISHSVKRGPRENLPDSPTQLHDLLPFLKDSSSAVREKAYEMWYRGTIRSSSDSIRAQGVNILLQACIEGDLEMTALVLSFLSTFKADDFKPQARDKVRMLMRKKTGYTKELMKLSAFLGLTDMVEDIRKYSFPGNHPSMRWASLISLARLSDGDAASEIMRRVKKIPIGDDLIYNVFPDLVFTRHPTAIAYMVEVLNSDVPNCLSADAEREVPIPCGYRIMELLAPVIKNYPLELTPSGDLEAGDYREALRIAREWFRTHHDYIIMTKEY